MSSAPHTAKPTIYTVGHSTRSLDELIEILKAYGIKQLVDVRSVPRSRHTPQFNADELTQKLPVEDIAYMHIEKLGGLRHAHKDSINLGWHNASFRGYADYMQTDDFAAGMDELVQLSKDNPTAIMCAEAVPWRCHRSMIGDALIVRGYEVLDIFDVHTVKPETLTDFAKVNGQDIIYPAENQ